MIQHAGTPSPNVIQYIVSPHLEYDSACWNPFTKRTIYKPKAMQRRQKKTQKTVIKCRSQWAGLLRRGMVYELERVLRVCDGFFCSKYNWCSG